MVAAGQAAGPAGRRNLAFLALPVCLGRLRPPKDKKMCDGGKPYYFLHSSFDERATF